MKKRSLTWLILCACSSYEVRIASDGSVPSNDGWVFVDGEVVADGQIVHDSPLFPDFTTPDAQVVWPDAGMPADGTLPDAPLPDAPIPDAGILADATLPDAPMPDALLPDASVPPPTMGTWTAMTTEGAPQARRGFTAVWTGSEMLVWGGQGSAGVLGDGARYNPATNTWTLIATDGAPEARYNHTAVWTGQEMIVWGGMGSAETLRTGGRYNPSTNTWTVVANPASEPVSYYITMAPTARQGHSAVWSGSDMLIWGGENGTGQLFNVGGQYNPAVDAWYVMNEPPYNAPLVTRKYHSAVWTGVYMIIWGGWNAVWFADGRKYSPSQLGGSWSQMPTSSARGQHSAVWTGQTMIVWGGQDTYGFLNTGGKYHATGSWSDIALEEAPSARVGHSAVWTLNKMVVWGGRNEQGAALGNGALYNPLTDAWEIMASENAPTARWGHTAVWTGYEMLLWGGCVDFYCATPLNTGGRYVP